VTEVRTVRRQKGRVNFKDGGSQLELDRIVAELEEERDRLDQAITLLRELDHTATARKAIVTNGRVSTRSRARGLTPAGRKRLSELMKKRWAERKRKAKSS
jgi:hypothetical protein